MHVVHPSAGASTDTIEPWMSVSQDKPIHCSVVMTPKHPFFVCLFLFFSRVRELHWRTRH